MSFKQPVTVRLILNVTEKLFNVLTINLTSEVNRTVTCRAVNEKTWFKLKLKCSLVTETIAVGSLFVTMNNRLLYVCNCNPVQSAHLIRRHPGT